MTDHNRDTLYIDGQWVSPHGTGTIDVINPATEQVIGHVPHGDQHDLDAAVDAARRRFDPLVSVDERRARLDAIIRAMEKNADSLAETVARELGAPLKIARALHVQLGISAAQGIMTTLEGYNFEERVGNSLLMREPYGVVGAITPWNYPIYQVVVKVLPAIAAGCTVVLKPGNEAPLSVFELVDAIHDEGLPAGVLNVVSGPGGVIGEAIAAHPGIDLVSFTGSTAVGSRVAEVAAGTVKKLTLELGGKSANVILDDADLAAAVKVGVGTAFLNGGQTCTAWTRMLVPRSRYDEALELIQGAAARYTVGDPFDEATRVGPVVSRKQLESIRGFIDRAEKDGARLLHGGSQELTEIGCYVCPTVFADVDPNSELGQEEVFGPVLAVIPYETEAEALEIANGTDYGLSGAVWSADTDRAIAFARRVQTGSLDINGGSHNPLAPFGGYKRSGYGRELGRAGFEEYLQLKSLQLPS
ncbi:aldehyde dehydrogenase family protein [Rhodococcus opacus]|uniref:aldehyde dehydrogenase family protein n=1 Tax=Rhodococcus opacus TaxID=37919 RepID=UPI002472FB88|nr:aldehyde dehydrogenase family protein [Rhodococcus opacus]MDH6292036.1 aldehyde dehydrogenase (NAD+) [Rhodococcus opacus]